MKINVKANASEIALTNEKTIQMVIMNAIKMHLDSDNLDITVDVTVSKLNESNQETRQAIVDQIKSIIGDGNIAENKIIAVNYLREILNMSLSESLQFLKFPYRWESFIKTGEI